MDGVADTWYGVSNSLWIKKDSLGVKSIPKLSKLQELAKTWKSEGDESLDTLWAPSDEKNSKSFSDHVLKSGTAKDKLAALVVSIQSGPIENALMVKKLLAMSKHGQRAQRVMAAESLADVFSSIYIPSDRKLNRFLNPSVLETLYIFSEGVKKGKLSEKEWTQALFWASWEDWLKLSYAEYIGILEEMCKDTLQWVRYKALDFLGALISSCAEGENVVLALIVNKLGDSVGKIASHASKTLLRFMSSPIDVSNSIILQNIVKSEVQTYLTRKDLDANAKLAGINFLTQFQFHETYDSSRELAMSLMKLYFRLFQEMTLQNDVINFQSKMLSALLTGIDRCLPYIIVDVNASNQSLEDVLGPYMDSLFTIVHGDNFPAKIQSLSILFQLTKSIGTSSEKLSDRYFNCLYAFVSSAENVMHMYFGAKKLQLLLNVLFRSLKLDLDKNRVTAFVKRLLQMSHHSNTQMICSILYLVSKVEEHGGVVDAIISVAEDNADHPEQYDMNKRNPKGANAENTCLWELFPLYNHFHPSVRKFTGNILSSESIQYKGDFLRDFSGTAFLERFVFKNPKKVSSNENTFARGVSVYNPNQKEYERIREEIDGQGLFQKYFGARKQKPVDDSKDEDEFADMVFQQELDNNEKSAVGGDDSDSDGIADVFDASDEEDFEGIQLESNSPFAAAEEFETLMEQIQEAQMKRDSTKSQKKRKNDKGRDKERTKNRKRMKTK